MNIKYLLRFGGLTIHSIDSWCRDTGPTFVQTGDFIAVSMSALRSGWAFLRDALLEDSEEEVPRKRVAGDRLFNLSLIQQYSSFEKAARDKIVISDFESSSEKEKGNRTITVDVNEYRNAG